MHISVIFFGGNSEQSSFKDGLGGALGNRGDSFKRYQKTENRWKWEQKFIKEQKICYIACLRSQAHVMISKISRRSRISLPRSAVNLAEIAIAVIQIQILAYLVIISERN